MWRDYGQTLPAQGGREARTQRGAFGGTWWSNKFLALFQRHAEHNRLSRGRSYARRGQVMDPQIQPGLLQTTVQGSHPTPYQVSLRQKILRPKQRQQILQDMLASPEVMRGLGEGQLHPSLESLFKEAGAPLFARPEISCDCMDWGSPCKHGAALCYLWCDIMEEEPLLVLTWRGVDTEALESTLALFQHGEHEAAPLEQTDWSTFWGEGPGPLPAALLPHPIGDPAGALSQLGLLGQKSGRQDAAQRLEPCYPTATEAAWGLLQGDGEWGPLLSALGPLPAPPAGAPLPDPVDTQQGDALLELLWDLYQGATARRRRAVFEAWCAGFGTVEVEGQAVHMKETWRDPEALFDLLVDEDDDTLRAFARSLRR